MQEGLMLFECLECEETYLADNMCDGYNCPKCNGHIVPKGYIKELEESVCKLEKKIDKAKTNGLIRTYKHKAPKPNLPPTLNNYVGGVDLSETKDFTVKISFNAEEFNKDLINKLTKEVEEHKRNIGHYIKCSYE